MKNELRDVLDRLATAVPVVEVDGRRLAFLPEGYTFADVTIPTVPDRIIQRPVFHDAESLVQYVQRYREKGSLLVADIDAGDLIVAIDYHSGDADSVEAVDHVARWDLAHSEEFKAWEAMEGRLHDQDTFMRFLEENVTDVILPDPAALMDLVRDFDAIKSVKFRSSRRLDNGDRRLEYVEDTGTKSGVSIPQKLTLNIPIYRGEPAIQFDVLFRWRINDGQLALGYEFHRLEPVKQAAFVAAVVRVAEATSLTAHFGQTRGF